MNLRQVSLFLVFLGFLLTFTAASNNLTHFKGDVSINCGSTGTFAASDGRQWIGDEQPKLSSLLQLKGLSASSTVVHKLTSADPVPHKTARLSRSRFSYAFQVDPGQKIIRLHFNPTLYKGFEGLKDLFTVEAGHFTFLSNFSASLTADALVVNTFAKEYCLNIQESQQFDIVFSPKSSQSLDTYAFINGIEIISVPAGLSYFYGGDMGFPVVDQKSLVYVDNSIALEIVHRLYVRKDFVSSADDSSDISRMWATVPKQEVNDINNITWEISVDAGFRYLVKLHFSKIGFKMAKTDGLSFKVLINEMVANTNTDIVVKERDKSSRHWYEDYEVMMNGCKQEGKCSLSICLQWNEEFMDGHGPLKGFEILKLSNPDRSLASSAPLLPAQYSSPHIIQILIMVLHHIKAFSSSLINPITIAIAINIVIIVIVFSQRIDKQDFSSEEEDKPSALSKRICRCFSLAEIKSATRNFNDGLLIGRRGSSHVYKGQIDKGEKTVAVKRLKSNSKQGEHELQTEIETLSEVRHDNLVSLIGYCSEGGEMILVYEYMACGTLADRLYQLGREVNNSSSLTWKQRLHICIGAAQGLDYLHLGHGIIHGDIKSSNILLDEDFVAKVSDFGLVNRVNRSKSNLQSHVSIFGYIDQDYNVTDELILKSDTYAFGVVLLEVLCGRPAVDSGVPEDERILTKWSRDKISKGEVDQIVDSNLREEISQNSLKTFLEVAERCLDAEPENRPTMSEVVLQLELALKQQEINHEEKEQSNRKMAKAATHKEWRLWPWEAFWNRAHPSNEIELVLSESINSELAQSSQASGGNRGANLQYDMNEKSFCSTSNQSTMIGEVVASTPKSYPQELEIGQEIWDEEVPMYLKDFISFCSIFPTDYEFTKDVLVWQWIAGGLIKLGEDEIMEEECIKCFGTLLSRDYIVPSRHDHFVDQMKYKIGDKMIVFLQKQLLEPKFRKYFDSKRNDVAKVEHLSLAYEEIDGEKFGALKQYSHLQTLVIHRCYGSKLTHLPSDLFLELKVLKILNLSYTDIVELPSSVENLKKLRYLDMSDTPICWLPESICCFSNLQTIKLDGCLSLGGLPKSTSKLINLRHLVLDVVRQLQSMPTGIGKLSNLQTLSAFLVGEDDGCRIVELKDMKKLRGSFRVLNLENVKTGEEAAEACLSDKQDLRKMELEWSDFQDEKNPDEDEILESLQPPFSIQELKILFYSGGVLPSWICNPLFSDLVKIILYKCRYYCSLPSLGELPSLKHLSIVENNEVEEINNSFCRKQTSQHHVAFPKLEKLSFDSMSKLEKWTSLENGDFPSLRHLIIEDCPKFVGLPSLSRLNSLLHVEISDCPELSCFPEDGLSSTLESLMIKDCPKLEERCCNEQCEEWSKVAHVPGFFIDGQQISP